MRVVSYWPESDRSVGIHAVLSPSLALYRIPRSLLNAFLVPVASLVRPTSPSTCDALLTSLGTFLQLKRPDQTVLHLSFNEIEALLVVDACERALFDDIVAMHTPREPGMNNLNNEARHPAASIEAAPKLTVPLLGRVIASPEAWCLFAVDYSHFSNVTARQLTQLLGQASIPFIYSAGHNLEYIWVMTLNSSIDWSTYVCISPGPSSFWSPRPRHTEFCKVERASQNTCQRRDCHTISHVICIPDHTRISPSAGFHKPSSAARLLTSKSNTFDSDTPSHFHITRSQ